MSAYCATGLSEAVVVQWAERLAHLVEETAILCLEGDLGAGKSTFARAWIRAATGEIDIPSPTFSLVQEYRCLHRHQSLYHADLYRLKQAEELEELGFDEMLSSGICLIEWASRIPEMTRNTESPLGVLRLDFSGENHRNLYLESQDDFWCACAENIGMERRND